MLRSRQLFFFFISTLRLERDICFLFFIFLLSVFIKQLNRVEDKHKIKSKENKMGLLPTDYNEAKRIATLGHAMWGVNLAGSWALGHFRPTVGGVQLGTTLAINGAMFPFSALHFGLTYMYAKKNNDAGVATYNRRVALPLNAFLVCFALALDVFHAFGFWDARSVGLGDFEHGVYAASMPQVAVNALCYFVLFLGELPLILGWHKGKLPKVQKKQ